MEEEQGEADVISLCICPVANVMLARVCVCGIERVMAVAHAMIVRFVVVPCHSCVAYNACFVGIYG